MIVYTWADEDHQEHCSIDILLLSGTTMDQIKTKVHKSGKHVIVTYMYPRTFLMARCLVVANAGERIINSAHTKTSVLDKAITVLQEAHDMEDIFAEFKIKLPFKVAEKFDGTPEFCMYQHENKDYYQNKQFYYVLHIELLSTVKPREPKPEIFARIVSRTIFNPNDSDKKATSIFKGDGCETPCRLNLSLPSLLSLGMQSSWSIDSFV